MARHIALLRGINVGGRNKVEMARLRELVERLGYRDVRTYVQSGNVVFTGPEQPTEEVAQRFEEEIAATFGLDVSVMVRSRDELAAVVRANPLGDVATDPARYQVLFLDTQTDPQRVADIDQEEFAPEVFHLRGQEIYCWLPGGAGESRLMKALSDKRLGVTTTARNWKTVEKLLALADEA